MTGKPALPLPHLLVAAGGVYTAQSLVGGLTFMGIPAILRAEGVPLEQIGLVSMVMLVWALKFLWSAPVERWRRPADGRRRSRGIILAGEVLVVLLLLALGLSGKAGIGTVLMLLVAVAVVSATVDIACDAFLIEQLPEGRRGAGNVAQVGGGYLGLIFGSGLFVIAVSMAGWLAACALMAGLVLAMSLPMAIIREPAVAAEMPDAGRPAVFKALRTPPILLGLLMTLVFESGGRLTQALSGPFLVDAGMPLSVIGALNGIGGVAAGLAGVAAGGFAVQRLGAQRAVWIVAAAHVATLGLIAGLVASGGAGLGVLAAAIITESAMMAAGFVVLYSRLMGLVSPSQPGVDFTLFQCASAIAAAMLGIGGAQLAARTGYVGAFVMAACLAVVAVLALPLIERRLAKGSRP